MRPTWLVWVVEMSKASPRTAGSVLRSGARLAISTPCRWWRAMSRENPTSTAPRLRRVVPADAQRDGQPAAQQHQARRR